MSLQGVGALMEYLRTAFETLNLIGLLTFLSRFCSDTGPLLLDNSIINYCLYFFVSLPFRKSVFSFPPDSICFLLFPPL